LDLFAKSKNKIGKKCNSKQCKVKQLKMTKRTKTNKLSKMRYFKIPLCPKFIWCEKTKMPLGAKMTQTDSDWLRCRTKTILYKIWSMIHADRLKRLRDKLQGLKWVPL